MLDLFAAHAYAVCVSPLDAPRVEIADTNDALHDARLPPCLTCTTMSPGVLPVEACGSPLNGFGPRRAIKIRFPDGAMSIRSGEGSSL